LIFNTLLFRVVFCALLLSSLFIFIINNNIQSSRNSVQGQQEVPKLPGIKITSPIRGELIPVPGNGTNNSNNNSLTVSGTSTDNANSACEVSVILNDIRPYQPAVPIGTSGKQDYSKWNFILTPSYGTINQGENKITAKLSCLASPNNLTKWYSINITGATPEQILQQEQQLQKEKQQQQQLLLQQEQQLIERAQANAEKINQTAMFVTIESHKLGQHVPIGTNLTISGQSSDNSTTDCDVSVILNSQTPYQQAFPADPLKINDYSNWTFIFTPDYTVPKEGANKITSKISCLAYPNNLTKWYSVNVTGVPDNIAAAAQQQQQINSSDPSDLSVPFSQTTSEIGNTKSSIIIPPLTKRSFFSLVPGNS
jgi:hypothetical protein